MDLPVKGHGHEGEHACWDGHVGHKVADGAVDGTERPVAEGRKEHQLRQEATRQWNVDEAGMQGGGTKETHWRGKWRMMKKIQENSEWKIAREAMKRGCKVHWKKAREGRNVVVVLKEEKYYS